MNVTVDNLLSLYGGGQISSRAFSRGKGGNLSIHAGSLLMDGSGNLNFVTSIVTGSNPGARGSAGDLSITVDNLLAIYGRGRISADTFSIGNGGNLSIHAGSLLIDGSATPNSDITGIAVTSHPEATGNAGNITIVVDQTLNILGGGQISADTFSRGKGGNIGIHAGSLSIDGSATPDLFTGISAETFNDGDAGTMTIAIDKLLSIVGGGQILADTSSNGKGGDVIVHAGSLSIDGSATPDLFTGISSDSYGSGEAGSVFISTAGPLKLKHGASISTFSQTTDAGSITIISGGEIKLSDQSSISVSAGHIGGDIHITTPELVYLLDSSITATAGASGVSGQGGNIRIDPTFIVLNNSLISANAAVGQGGNINLVSDFFFNSNSSITATGTTNGTVNITAPTLDLGSELITLPVSLLSAENQLQERCTALLRGDFSSFISIGRGGTEPAPEELQTTF